MIAHLITSVAGSSNYYKGSVIAYANEIKISQLSVSEITLTKFGAVSEDAVKEMATGVLEKFKTDFSISVSGVAGPTGGTDEKPVGTVWIAVAGKGKVVAKKFQFGDNRERNILRASVTALGMLRKFLLGELE